MSTQRQDGLAAPESPCRERREKDSGKKEKLVSGWRRKKSNRVERKTPRAGDIDEPKVMMWVGGRGGGASNNYIKVEAREERERSKMKDCTVGKKE